MKIVKYSLFFFGILIISVLTFVVVLFLEINKILGGIFNSFRKIIIGK